MNITSIYADNLCYEPKEMSSFALAVLTANGKMLPSDYYWESKRKEGPKNK